MASQTAMFSPKPRIMYHSTVASRSHSHSHSSDAEEESETCEEISNNSELCLETQRHIAIARRVKAQQHKGLKALTHTISDSDSSDEEGVVRGRRRIIPRKRVCQENICDDHELYDESEEEEGMSHIKPVTIDPDTSEYSSEEEEDPHDAHGQTHHHHHNRPNRHSLNHSIQSMESTEMSCEENTSGEQQHTCDSHTCACVHNDNCMVEDSDHKQLDTSKESLESSEEAQLLQEIANSNLNNATLNPDDKILYMQQIRENLLKSRKQHQHHQQHRLLHHRHHHQHHNSDYLVLESEVMSPEEDDSSCNSSRVSNQSEKNMADFDGEDVVSEDEIGPSLSAIAGHHSPATTPTSIAAGAADVVHRHDVTTSTSVDNAQHLESINNLFCQKQNIPTPKRTVRSRQDSCTNYNWDHVCHKGNTVLWDLIQDDQSMKLAEGIAEETEKALCNLLCVSADRKIRTKFIEACVENIANNRSVVVSLRLLPKLFNSFQQYRSSMQNTHTIAMWAEHDLSVMKHFFNNLIYYKQCQLQGSPQQQNTLYGHKEEVQVRLYFLTCMFSTSGSPNDFKLSSNQLSILWDCLVTNSKCSDDCLNWFLQQVKSKDQHALSVTTLQILFADKIPELGAEKMTMVGLNLFMQLLQFSKIAGSGLCTPTADQQFCGMNQLWRIALRAHNTDVSLNAIQSLNNYYIKSGINNLREEEEFVERSMESLVQASSHLEESPDTNLLIIQRGLILLTSHLEDFRKRYAFHLRNWKLAGCGIGSHQKTLTEKDSSPVRIILQPGGFSEKTTIQMYTSDLVSELRAEVTKWWQDLRTQQQAAAAAAQNDAADGAAASTSNNTHGQPTPILGSMLGEGPVRIITQGQELTVDLDEKTLADVQFKDLQIVFVSLGANRSQRKSDLSAQHPIQLEEHERQRLPMIFLLQDQHFSRLFSLLDQLTKFSIDDDSKLDLQFASNLEMKAHMLSKKVWELVMLLPTSPKIMDGFKNIKTDAYINWERLLPTDSSHKLMYSLQIVESLSRAPRNRLNSAFTSTSERPSCDSDVSVEGLDTPEEIWSQNFIDKGGLKHLFNIFLSGSLQQSSDTDHWDQWKQDCLAYLLRLLSQFAISDSESGDDAFDDSTQKKTRKSSKSEVKLVVPTLNQVVISMGQVEQTMKILLNIVYDAALPHEDSSHGYQTTAWGRVEVVHYALAFLVSLAHSYNQQVHDALCDDKKFPLWLKRLTLETPEPLVRKEVSHGLYRLFMGQTSKGISGYSYLLPMLEAMLIHLPEAQNIKQSKRWEHLPEDKETYGPCCRDYFWLTCRLVQSIKPEDVRCSWKKGFTHDLDSLAKYVADAIVARPFNEKRINTIEDYGLIGLLELMKSLARHRTPFFSSDEGHAFLKEAFNLLFALPSPEHRYFPKAKTHDSRSVVYDVMVEMVKGNTKNYRLLHAMVSKQHVKEAHAQYSWDNWPHEEGRSNCGYVGLTNLGATCYMATCMQHLYMIPEARKSVLEAQQSALNNQHEGTLYELKKMFAYLLESERKAYNPKSFCKVYTMDKQPLNTCEQKDMTEFFTDLISKMEEMGPQLKKLVKSLFGGVLTNNVVSLDCPHVSRTKEEFYTVRCQVADMKNLYESLDEVTVKDMLEGDNMYTCSRCQKKVRAEKRACFRTLPKILCFNTMRYTFNMITMTKEKVNTHFSFPLRLDMTGYMEENLIKIRGDEESSDDDVGGAVGNSSSSSKNNQCYQYQLIGVTVHTGTADGGHYYSFIRDKLSTNQQGQDKWFLFNDAEVKHFDPQQIASECFGGEMTSKTYDSVTDKFMDFSFEKTHSAYMLFYERIERTSSATSTSEAETSSHTQSATSGSNGAGTGGATGNKSPVASGSTSSSATQGSTSLAAMKPTAGTSSEPVAGTSSDSAVQLHSSTSICDNEDVCQDDDRLPFKIDLTKELLDMIWEDNMQFLQDKNVFETNYFWFMWQMCGFLQTTLEPESSGAQREEGEDDIALLAAKLTASFVLETFIHAKEKPTMLQWIELLTKQFNSCQSACEWFLDSMAEDDWWPQKNLIKCPSQVVRQMFQRLLIHVISQLRSKHHHLYLEPLGDQDDVPTHLIGSSSCVTRFIRKMLNIIAAPQKPNTRYLSEYFTFLFDFARMGEEECLFLIQTNAISTMINFYIGHKTQESFVDVISDDDDEDEDDDDILPMTSTEDRYRPQALEKMISLIALLVEKSRGDDKQLHLLPKDRMAIIGGKGYPFLINQIRDNINLRQTASLIINLCRWNDSQAILIIQMIFSAISKMGTESQNFFKILSLLMEYIGTVPGTPHFTQFILHKFWSIFDYCPQQCLDWLSIQVCRNKHVHQFVLQHLDSWVEHYLMAHANTRVRNSAAILLVSLVPSSSFRQAFRMSRSVLSPQKDFLISNEALLILHEIYGHLLKLLTAAPKYIETSIHGTAKLVAYFGLMTYCLLSKTEKLMFSQHFMNLWNLFQPKMAEPSIQMYQNKQALLLFWHQVCVDCNENVKLIVSSPHVVKQIAFNYIFVDNEDQELVLFNRCMLPAYYGILRMCCMQSPAFTRQLANHQNIQWAFRYITPFPTHYNVAVDELLKMMRLMVHVHDPTKPEETRAVNVFKKSTIQLYLQHLDTRMSWQTFVMALKILVENNEDKLHVLYHNGLQKMFEAFNTLHAMYHEATACHVTADLSDLLEIMVSVYATARTNLNQERRGLEVRNHLQSFKEKLELMRKLLTLLNSYTPPDIRNLSIALLKELVLSYQSEIIHTLVPMLLHAHVSGQRPYPLEPGPYFPRRGQKPVLSSKATIRPSRPQFQMYLVHNQLECSKFVDPAYDQAVYDYFKPYHNLVDLIVRVAVNQHNINEKVISLSAVVAYEGVPMHMPYFTKLWYEIYQLDSVDKKCIELLCAEESFTDYMEMVLTDERQILCQQYTYQFFCNFFPKVYKVVLRDGGQLLLNSLLTSLSAEQAALEKCEDHPSTHHNHVLNRIYADVRALSLVYSVQQPKQIPKLLNESLHTIRALCKQQHGQSDSEPPSATASPAASASPTASVSVASNKPTDPTPSTSRALCDATKPATDKAESCDTTSSGEEETITTATSADEDDEHKERTAAEQTDEDDEEDRSHRNGNGGVKSHPNNKGVTPSKRRRLCSGNTTESKSDDAVTTPSKPDTGEPMDTSEATTDSKTSTSPVSDVRPTGGKIKLAIQRNNPQERRPVSEQIVKHIDLLFNMFHK